MGISLKEVLDNKLLSDELMACIPHHCECGAEIEFTESLRQIYCSNPDCFYKIASRLEAMAKHMKADGWGESTCIEVCKTFKLKSPYQVFLLEGGNYKTSISAFDKKIASICDKERRKVELWEVVKFAGIPSIETIAYKIFNGYNNLSEAFADIERGQVAFIANKLGLKTSDGGVMAVNIYQTLLKYKEELLFGEKQFDIYKPSGKTVYLAITGGVSGYRNKSEFIAYLKERYKGKLNPMLLSSVSSQVDILIADGDTSSNKYKTAMRLNDKYLEKLLKSGECSKNDVGIFRKADDLHPVGEKILITNSTDVFNRLDKITTGSK